MDYSSHVVATEQEPAHNSKAQERCATGDAHHFLLSFIFVIPRKSIISCFYRFPPVHSSAA